MNNLIQPKILKGFRDSLPDSEIIRASLIEKITETYRSFGFVPIDTPALEYSEILLRKSSGETEKQVFRFEDNGGRDVALRFDLTVPFARFTAEHYGELYLPFKRYHIAKVWRGEKPQAGRYREFVQCDVDTVGSDSAASDFEILNVMKCALNAIGALDITIRVNHRGIFNRFLTSCGVSDKSESILRAVDKIAKTGKESVHAELTEICGGDNAQKIIEYIDTPKGETFEQTLARLERLAGGADADSRRLCDVYGLMCAAGIENAFVLDPSITRGLDYYTGIVYETFLNALPAIGSVCSGGRYDNLTALYMKERVPGVGGSIGIDRLITALEQLTILPKGNNYLDAEIFCINANDALSYQKAAAALRSHSVRVEVFPDAKKMNQQYALAEAKRIPWGILISPDDAKNGTLSLKNLLTRELTEHISFDEAAAIILKTRKEQAVRL